MGGIAQRCRRNPAAHDDASANIEVRQRCVIDVSTDIVEIHIDTFRAGGGDTFYQRGFGQGVSLVVLVEDDFVEAELVDGVAPFCLDAGNADRPAAFYFGDLADQAAHRAPAGTYKNGLAFPRLTGFKQSEIGGHSRHAEDAERHGGGRALGINLERYVRPIGDGILLKSEHTNVEITDGKFVVVRFNDPADGGSLHHFPELDPLCVIGFRAHPSHHKRVEGQPFRPDEKLICSGAGQRRLGQLEQIGCQRSVRTFLEKDLFVGIRRRHRMLRG